MNQFFIYYIVDNLETSSKLSFFGFGPVLFNEVKSIMKTLAKQRKQKY